MLSKLFGTESFSELLGTPSFWYTIFIIIGVVILLVYSIKYWKQGGKWAILGLFVVAFTAVTMYSAIQLNYYYSAEGGIHGAITGIFNTNEIEIVDDLTFKLDNIELTQKNETIYSASITSNKIISINTREKLGVFINDVPCTTSDIHEDYVIATYSYTFYDNDKTEILTDTLMLNFAFYTNSTYFELSTAGNADAINLWNSYFNKNNFIVRISEFKNILDSDYEFIDGDISNYAVVRYTLDGKYVASQVYVKGSKLELMEIEQEHMGWTLNDIKVFSSYIVTEDITLNAIGIYENTVTLLVGDTVYNTFIVETGSCVNAYIPTSFIYSSYSTHKVIVDYWTLDGQQVDVKTCVIMEDIEFIAVTHVEYLVNIQINGTNYLSEFYAQGTSFSLPELPSNFVLDHWEDSEGNVITDISFIVNGYKSLNAIGSYTTYTLSVSTTGYAKVPTYTIENTSNSTISLEVPTMEGYTFVEWRMDSGAGYINGNEFTFGTGDASIYAVYNYTGLYVTSEESFNVTIGNNTYTADGGVHMEDPYYCDMKIIGNSSSIVLTNDISSVVTDGEYDITLLDSGYYNITYTNASYLWIICGSSIGGGNGSIGGGNTTC